jgi:hypothetical protein
MKLSRFIKIFKNRYHLKKAIDDHIFFLEHPDMTVWGSITNDDATGIIENVKEAASYSGPIIEIGALFGFTTQLIATYKPTEKKLIAVENFSWNPFGIPSHDHKTITERVLIYCTTHCNTHIYNGSNQQFYEAYNGEKPSMIFIDADHSYEGVMEDIEWSEKMGIPIICGHDYCELHPGVVQAVDESFGGNISVSGSIWTAC